LAVDKRRRFGKLRANMRRPASISGFTFLLFFAWKVGLLLFTAQPVPANDSFFYDGPVVNYLLHGRYCNPSLAEVLPISGTQVFSAYPPGYQFALMAWMKLAGTSALAAMWFHVLLLGVFALTIYSTLRRLQASAAAIHWAGLFLFAITFHDRPDTLAQVFGALAVWAFVHGYGAVGRIWPWVTAGFLLLTVSTSLQIGGIYSLFLALLVLGGTALKQVRPPWWTILVYMTLLAGGVTLVKLVLPHMWAGFQEHLTITPSVTGWRLPGLGELLKIGRAAAGIFFIAAILGLLIVTRNLRVAQLRESPSLFVAVCGVLTSMALIMGCLVILTPNTIHIANYLQPLIVGSFLAWWPAGGVGDKPKRVLVLGLTAALLLVSIRAIGMTTWGVLCARDVGYAEVIQLVQSEVETIPEGQTIAASSAYLYQVARSSKVIWIHSDWIGNIGGGRVDLEPKSLIKLRPQKLILTQFDYYRRYYQILPELRGQADVAGVRIRNFANLPPPDAIPALQKILQHISWAPVIVEFSWSTNSGN